MSRPATASKRRWIVFACLLAACCALAVAAQAPPPDAIGTIEGDDLLVQGAPNEAMVVKQGITPLDGGASVTVRTGQALVELAGGGEIGVCGPAHFSVLQSGSSLTLALDYGRVHPRLPPSADIMIYTPLIAATPISIGGQRRDLTVGLASDGAMCVTSSQGAVRIAQQLSDQSVIVPEGGAIDLAGGALAPAGEEGSCSCEVQLARNAPPAPVYVNTPGEEASAAIPPSEIAVPAQRVDTAPPPRPTVPAASSDDQPIYQVFMPPLRFDASADPASTDPNPQMIVIVRHVRVRPGAMFVGVVEAAELPPANSLAPMERSQPASAPAANSAAASQRRGAYDRVRDYLRNLFGNPS